VPLVGIISLVEKCQDLLTLDNEELYGLCQSIVIR
jgi:hypothetical protein